MWQVRMAAFLLLFSGCAIGFFVVHTERTASSPLHFKYGLDLVGGSHLLYEADTSSLEAGEEEESLAALRDVIERRINVFGVSEPLVQTERTAFAGEGTSAWRLIVELPGITDVDEAVAMIGATPLLEFKLIANPLATTSSDRYRDTGLTGALLSRARLEFGQATAGGIANEPVVAVTFNSEGTGLFEEITTAHTGEQLAIFLDGVSLSEPVIREPIGGGTAIISGGFTPEEARQLVSDLNIGALPIPISLLSVDTVGATLGAETLDKGVRAGLIGIMLVMLFMVLWYRLPGLIAALALAFFIVIMLALIKVIPVVLTAAGIAGLILTVGMAVDANVLIFERVREERRGGLSWQEALRAGFSRAWPAIRDGNITSILSALMLFFFGTSLVKGFALVFGLGVLVSMITAITLTRVLLMTVTRVPEKGIGAFLFSSGNHFT